MKRTFKRFSPESAQRNLSLLSVRDNLSRSQETLSYNLRRKVWLQWCTSLVTSTPLFIDLEQAHYTFTQTIHGQSSNKCQEPLSTLKSFPSLCVLYIKSPHEFIRGRKAKIVFVKIAFVKKCRNGVLIYFSTWRKT